MFCRISLGTVPANITPHHIPHMRSILKSRPKFFSPLCLFIVCLFALLPSLSFAACIVPTEPDNLRDLQEDIPLSGKFHGWRWTGGAGLGEIVMFEGWAEDLSDPDIDYINSERQVRINGRYVHNVVEKRHGAETPGLAYNDLTECRKYTLAIRNYSSRDDCWRVFRFTAKGCCHPVAITRQPDPQTVMYGKSVSLSVAATGTQPIVYQWYQDGVKIPGATRSALSIPNAADGDEGVYFCTVDNSCGPRLTSNRVQLNVVSPPVITELDPIPVKVLAGDSVTFYSGLEEGTEPINWQWLINGVPQPGANGEEYTLSVAQLDHSGTVTVRASNSAGSAESSVQLKVVEPLRISGIQSLTGPFAAGTRVDLKAVFSGSCPCTFQWSHDSEPVAGAVGPEYSFIMSAEAAGEYSINIVGCDELSEDEASVDVELLTPPLLAPFDPASMKIVVGEDLELTADLLDGTEPATWQWFFNGSALPSANSDTLSIFGVSTSQAGSYRVRVSNPGGHSEQSIEVAVVTPVQVRIQAPKTVVGPGERIVLNAVVTGTGPFTYQWEFDGLPIRNANQSTYELPPMKESLAGVYGVVVTGCDDLTEDYDEVSISAAPSVVPGTGPQLQIGRHASEIHLSFEGRLDQVYLLETRLGIDTDWVPAAKVTSSVDGLVTFTVSDPKEPMRFFRLTESSGDSEGKGSEFPLQFGTASACVPAEQILDDNAAWYPLEGVEDSWVEDVWSWNYGSAAGDVTAVPGMVGQGLLFDGASSSVELDATVPMLSKAGATVCFWINTTQTGTAPLITQANPFSGELDYRIELHEGQVRFSTSKLVIDARRTIYDGRFHHIAVVFGGGAAGAVYIDGALDGTVTEATSGSGGGVYSSAIGVAVTTLGTDPLADFSELDTAHFRGTLDELLLVNRALSPPEIGLIYGAAEAGLCPPSLEEEPIEF